MIFAKDEENIELRVPPLVLLTYIIELNSGYILRRRGVILTFRSNQKSTFFSMSTEF